MAKDYSHTLFETVNMLYVLHNFCIIFSEVNKLTVCKYCSVLIVKLLRRHTPVFNLLILNYAKSSPSSHQSNGLSLLYKALFWQSVFFMQHGSQDNFFPKWTQNYMFLVC